MCRLDLARSIPQFKERFCPFLNTQDFFSFSICAGLGMVVWNRARLGPLKPGQVPIGPPLALARPHSHPVVSMGVDVLLVPPGCRRPGGTDAREHRVHPHLHRRLDRRGRQPRRPVGPGPGRRGHPGLAWPTGSQPEALATVIPGPPETGHTDTLRWTVGVAVGEGIEPVFQPGRFQKASPPC